MPQEGALAAPASAHDDENIPPVHREGEVMLKDKAAISHREVSDE